MSASCANCGRTFDPDGTGMETLPIDWGATAVGDKIVLTCPACPAPVTGKTAPPSELACALAEELAFAISHRGQLSERALTSLEDHVAACHAAEVEPHPEVIDALDGFRGRGKWPL